MINHLDPGCSTEALQYAPAGILVIDREQRVLWTNQACNKIMEADCSAWVGKTPFEIAHTGLDEVISNTEDACTIKLPRPGGRHLKCLIRPLSSELADGARCYYLVDITDMVQLREELDRIIAELEAKATRDPLTGLLNHRGLMQKLDSQLSRSRRYNNPLSLLRMKITGHVYRSGPAITKNQVLLAIGHVLHDQLRWADISGRLDDEEFLVILPETGDDAAKTLAEKLRGHFEDLTVGRQENKIVVKMAFGTATWTKGDDQGKLLQWAEQDMQQSTVARKEAVTTEP